MDILKIVVSAPRMFGMTDFEKSRDLIEKAISEKHTVCSMQYLHGEVENTMGYDIGACLNAENCVEKEQYKEGIYDVKVIDYPNPCKAYLWNSNGHPRGLIVDSTIKEDVEFAKNKYTEKSDWL